jgi:hypothetical protein
MLRGGLAQGGEIVSEYSNTWIDVRHDDVRQRAMSGVSRGLGCLM